MSFLAASHYNSWMWIEESEVVTVATPYWASIIILVMFLSYTGCFNSHHIPVSAPMLLPLLPVLLSLFGVDSSLQSVILPLQRDCHCLSAQKNCLPAANLKIKSKMRRDCPQPSKWQAWTVVTALLLENGNLQMIPSSSHSFKAHKAAQALEPELSVGCTVALHPVFTEWMWLLLDSVYLLLQLQVFQYCRYYISRTTGWRFDQLESAGKKNIPILFRHNSVTCFSRNSAKFSLTPDVVSLIH